MNKQDVKVSIEVKLTSGATITLTNRQTERVEEAVYAIVFKEAKTNTDTNEIRVKRPYRRKRKVKRWSKDEEAMLASMLEMYPHGSPSHMAGLRSVAAQIDRPLRVVVAKAYRLERPVKKEQGLLD